MSIYNTANQPPENYMATISASPSKPSAPSEPDFGLDSLLGLVSSMITAPLYLYATLRGKFKVWDDILDGIPDALLRRPSLDVGCGRGMVLLKTAQRKQALGAQTAPAYGIDIFSTADQTGNAPEATYKNAAAMGVVDMAVLHTASFAETLPFADGVFGLVTANLSIHNAKREGRLFAVREMARVCAPAGRIVIVDLYGYFGDHKSVLEECGWTGVHVSFVGFKMLYGVLPCQILTATKPEGEVAGESRLSPEE
jgi:SAM-dependent methyltransferase